MTSLTEEELVEIKRQLKTRKFVIKTLKTILWICVLGMVGFIGLIIYLFLQGGMLLH